MKKLLSILASVLASAGIAYGATVALTTGPQNPADIALIVNTLVNSINSGVTPNSMAPPAQNRNFADNGGMNINQQGTGTITGGTTTITALQFAADRWFIDTNVGSGAGQAAVITASPAPPVGFTQAVKMWRNSGALLQPVCTLHEIETTRATQLQGQMVVLSAFVQPLAGLTSASGAIQMYVIYGTGTDQGLGTLTASPAITPAWTGIAGGTTALAAGTGSASMNLGTTAVWTRPFTVPFAIPITATEVGVEICFTPVGSASGATDGFAYTGVQLEILGPNATAPSTFEFKPLAYETQQAQRFFWQLNEPASGAGLPAWGEATGATATAWTFPLPVQMRGTTPVVAIPTTGTFKTNIAGTATTWVTPTAGVCSVFACTITGGNTNTAGQVEQVTGGGGTGVVYVKSDVIM